MRDWRLDVLRGIAIVLVIGNHINPQIMGGLIGDNGFVAAWKLGGWIGVDLFFLLSGYLISGLLFAEAQSNGRVQVGRFVIRRSFKILPPLYVYLFVTNIGRYLVDQWSLKKLVIDGLFLSNYFHGDFGHLWSLSVEEHFYALVAAACAFSGSKLLQHMKSHGFRLLLIISGVCLGLRVWTALALPYDLFTHYMPTHLRIDSLLAGVALRWFSITSQPALQVLDRRFRPAWIVGTMFVCVLPFVFERKDYPVVLSFLYTAMNLVFGYCIFAATNFLTDSWKRLLAPLALLGRHSYSVYLWHVPISTWFLPGLLRRYLKISNEWLILATYLTLSVGVGIAASIVVEANAIRVRDRLFPRFDSSRNKGRDSTTSAA